MSDQILPPHVIERFQSIAKRHLGRAFSEPELAIFLTNVELAQQAMLKAVQKGRKKYSFKFTPDATEEIKSLVATVVMSFEGEELISVPADVEILDVYSESTAVGAADGNNLKLDGKWPFYGGRRCNSTAFASSLFESAGRKGMAPTPVISVEGLRAGCWITP